MNKVRIEEINEQCTTEAWGPGGIRTRDSQTKSQYHNHWAKENPPYRSC